MKKLILILTLLVLPVGLGACKTTIDERRVVVDTDNHGHGNGDFCPPGQAKKGNC